MAHNKYEITCIVWKDSTNRYGGIKSVGGKINGTNWQLTEEEAIKYIESGKYSFYVRRNGYSTDVLVHKSLNGHKFLKTNSDGVHINNLVSLPICPR